MAYSHIALTSARRNGKDLLLGRVFDRVEPVGFKAEQIP
jgi:hypothetical protein